MSGITKAELATNSQTGGSDREESLLPQVGAYGDFGGRYASELLSPALVELEQALREVVPSRRFQDEFHQELHTYAGRPTSLTYAPRLSKEVGLEIFLKREDLLHGGAHKTNNVIGQALIARHLGKRRLVAETGAGQHGRATAMIGARFGLETRIYMGEKDAVRQEINVRAMELCGAEVKRVRHGAATLKEAISEALRDWTCSVDETHYLLGTVCGPHPFPSLVRELQKVIGIEARAQILEAIGRLPRAAVACVGGGSNAIGLFSAFLDDQEVRLFGAEPGGRGIDSGIHGATLVAGTPGILQGARTYVLQDREGQIIDAHSIAAGLDYPGVGPEHAYLSTSGRAEYRAVEDRDALAAFHRLSLTEGIIPALESAHALALLLPLVEEGTLDRGDPVLVNLSGRGEKDLYRSADELFGHRRSQGAKR